MLGRRSQGGDGSCAGGDGSEGSLLEKVTCQEICKEKDRCVAVTGDAGPLEWHLERWEDERL